MRTICLLSAVLFLAACGSEEASMNHISPPSAERQEKILSIHGDQRRDEYFWIRDDTREDPRVLALLEEENTYTRRMLAHTERLQKILFEEISNRLVADDRTVPVSQGKYRYYREYREGGEYPVYLRVAKDPEGEPQVLLDANRLSTGHGYYRIGNWTVSPGENIIAWAEDTLSRREYTIRFRDLDTGTVLSDRIHKVSTSLAWASDNRTIFYVDKEPKTLRPYRVYRHVLGTPGDQDVLVHEERDGAFDTAVRLTRSKQYILVSLDSTDSSEVRLIPADEPESRPRVFLPREKNHEYRVRHANHEFYILTNWQAKNFRLMKVAEGKTDDPSLWQEVVAHRDDVLLQDFEVFDRFLVINEKKEGLARLRIIRLEDGTGELIQFHDPTYSARIHANPEVDSTRLRYAYSSLTTPDSIYEFDMETGETRLLKEEKVLGGFDRNRYVSDRVWFEARDGVRVPVSLVYRKDRFRKGGNPLYVYGYGSYGYGMSPSFQSRRLSLLDRGFVYAIIHVRGGDELGRQWYEDGKLLKKKNTFNDFIDGTRFLVAAGYGDADRVFAAGGSAGGLLMGVIANEAPDLYRGIIAHVPFVDVVTTMLDESIPLTSGEFDEWGDPRQKVYYDYMLSYSPYDQVKAQRYPAMLVTTGLYDSQVQYFEPVKWVSRLRYMKLDDNPLLIDIDMDSGHGGASGRYEQHRLDAMEYAFILDLVQKERED